MSLTSVLPASIWIIGWANGCTTLGTHCTHALAIGQLTQDALGIVVSSRGPGLPSDRPLQVVRLNGNINQFEAAEGYEYNERMGRIVLAPGATPCTQETVQKR